MTESADSLLTAALELPDSERAEIAARLISSLEETEDEDSDAEIESAWAEEIERRISNLDSGRVRSVPWAEARRLIARDDDDTITRV